MLVEKTKPKGGNSSPRIGLLRVLRRRLWVIIAVAVVAVGSAMGFSLQQTPRYEASVRVLVGQEGKSDRASVAGDVPGLQQLTNTVAQAARSIPVAEAVLERVDLPGKTPEDVRGAMTAKQQGGTLFVDVSYRDTDPEKAQLVANTIGEVLSERISEIAPAGGPTGASTITAMVYEPAQLPQTPVSPDPVRNGGLALLLGVLLGVGLSFLLEYRADNWDSLEEVEQASGVPAFGIIPRFKVHS